MTPPPRPLPDPRLSRASVAFTLVELLVVVAIMVILISIGVRAFTSLGKGLPMRTAITQVSDSLSSARQLAISSNANTRFVVITDPTQPFRYGTFGILKETYIATSGSFSYIAAEPFQSLPGGIYFQADSSADNSANYMPKGNPSDPEPGQLAVRGQIVAEDGYRVVEFHPTGDTATSNEENLFVMGRGSSPGVLLSDTIDPDKATIVVGSSTGRVKVQSE